MSQLKIKREALGVHVQCQSEYVVSTGSLTECAKKNAIVAIRPPWSEPTMLLWHLLHSLVPNYHMAYSMGTIYITYHDH